MEFNNESKEINTVQYVADPSFNPSEHEKCINEAETKIPQLLQDLVFPDVDKYNQSQFDTFNSYDLSSDDMGDIDISTIGNSNTLSSDDMKDTNTDDLVPTIEELVPMTEEEYQKMIRRNIKYYAACTAGYSYNKDNDSFSSPGIVGILYDIFPHAPPIDTVRRVVRGILSKLTDRFEVRVNRTEDNPDDKTISIRSTQSPENDSKNEFVLLF